MSSLFEAIDGQDLGYFKALSFDDAKRDAEGIDLDGIDPGTRCTPLTWALECDQTDIAVELLFKGADPSISDGKGRLPAALASPLLKIFIEFFERFHLSADERKSPLHEEFLQYLDAVDFSSGHTMLSWAIERKHDELAAFLIRKRANLTLKNKHGHSALESAARAGSLDILDKILEKWPRLSGPDSLNLFRSALVCTVDRGRPQVIAALLSFFRRRYRAASLRHLSEKSLENYLIQEGKKRGSALSSEAYAYGVSPSRHYALTTERALSRASDACLLTDDEYKLLDMGGIWRLAEKSGNQQVLQMLAAHCKRPVRSLAASNDDV